MNQPKLLGRIAQKILSTATTMLPPCDQHWGGAMQNEFEYIEDEWEALHFANGCMVTTWRRQMNIGQFELFGRWTVTACLFIWAAAKLYVGFAVPPEWHEGAWSGGQIVLISAASIAYAGAGVSLFMKKWLAFGTFIVIALFLNSAHFTMIASGSYVEGYSEVPLVFSLAIVGEEYFIWTLAVAGGLALWAWPKIVSSGRLRFSW